MTVTAAVSGSVLVCPDASRVVVLLSGPVDSSTVGSFRELLDRAKQGRRDMVLDVSGMTLDAAALGVIADVASRLRAGGGSLELRWPTELTYEMCAITGLTEVLHVERPVIRRAGRTVTSPQGSGRDRLHDPDEAAQLVAARAAALAGGGGVSVALSRHGRLRTVAASDATVLATDHDQYDTGEGPCLDAATHGEPVHVVSLAAERRWRTFGPKARARGVEAVLSLPLFAADRPVGAMNVYTGAGGLTEGSAGWASAFATQASLLVTRAELAGPGHAVGDRLRDALRSRETIAQAQGVLMGRDGVSAESAHGTMRRVSRRTSRPLRDVAADQLAATAGAGGGGPAPFEVQPAAVSWEVSPQQADGTVFVRASGNWTGPATARIREVFDRAFRRRPTLVVADLAGVSALDQAGLAALLAAARRLMAGGCAVELQNLPPHVRRLAATTGLDWVLLTETAAAAPEPEPAGAGHVEEEASRGAGGT